MWIQMSPDPSYPGTKNIAKNAAHEHRYLFLEFQGGMQSSRKNMEAS
jgi:hypothetical protein